MLQNVTINHKKVKHKADADIRYHIYVFTFQIIKINRGLTVL